MFGVYGRRKGADSLYSDYRHFEVSGTVFEPSKHAHWNANVHLLPDQALDQDRRQAAALAVGTLQSWRGEITGYLSMPQDAVEAVLQMLIANRFVWLTMMVEPFRYAKATVRSFRLEGDLPPEDAPPFSDGD